MDGYYQKQADVFSYTNKKKMFVVFNNLTKY